MITGEDIMRKLKEVDEPEHCEIKVQLATPMRGVVRLVPIRSAHLFVDPNGHVLELTVDGRWETAS